MDNGTGGSKTALPTPLTSPSANARRRRRNGGSDDAAVRYFLPKPGTSIATPELGQEVASEGEALIQAFKSGQPFYTLAAWKAVPEVNVGGNPVIVRQVVAPKTVSS
jgi:hypothetical protein